MDSHHWELVRAHTQASQHYRWTVEELQRMVGRHEDTTAFRESIVAPARDVCQALLAEWIQIHVIHNARTS